MDDNVKFTCILLIIAIVIIVSGFTAGFCVGRNSHSGFCPKCNKWYDGDYYYCQDDGEKLLRPAEP